jgi:RimJ/RimL family protein N-acetyltransferase
MQYEGCYTLTLVLSEVDASAFEAQVREVAARGITFTTLAEEQRRQPDWLSRFCDLENETRKHIDAPRSVEQMRERLAFLKVVPEALFLAKLGERYIGYTCLNVAESTQDCLIQGWTGVRPEHRRQGIATALKMIAAAYAKERGYEKIVTTPRFNNTASVRMSRKVGFRELAG